MDSSVLSRYLRRIGFNGTPRTDLATLREVVRGHAQAIAFENIDAFTGRAVDLAPEAVEEKLLRRQRGGWCFEHNLLAGNALRALGFEVRDFAARVLWGREANARTPRTHRLLGVSCEGSEWLVDTGFGAGTPTAPLVLDSTAVQDTPHEPFRLRGHEDDLLLEVQSGSREGPRWLPLYRFDRQPQWPVDFEAANFQLAHDPQSPFVSHLVLARPAPRGRYWLRDREFGFRDPAGAVEQRRIDSFDELQVVLREAFGLEVDDVGALASRFAALE